jgi:RNA polymerase sigma-70 factor (ECF subfamily)
MLKLNAQTTTDEQLVEAIQQNDQEAFKILFYKYFKPLIRFAWYRINSYEICRDLVQELFLKIWIKRHQLIPTKSIKAYLYKSINNSIINHINLHLSQLVSLEMINNEKVISSDNKIDFKIDIQNAVNNLPEKIRTVYILSRIEGYSYSEISEICNISVKAVEKRMSKAFNLLKKFLE